MITRTTTAFFVGALSLASSAQAALIERTSVLDLSSLTLPTSDLLETIPVSPFSLDVGDTLIFHLEFVGGRLQIKDSAANLNDYIGLQFLSNPTGQTGFLFTGLWHFEDVSGELRSNDISLLYGGPIGGFTSNVNLTDTIFSLGGITYTVNVTYKDSGRPPFTADSVEFRAYTGGRPADAVSIQSVPEPQTYALFLAGLGLIGLMANRRKTAKEAP